MHQNLPQLGSPLIGLFLSKCRPCHKIHNRNSIHMKNTLHAASQSLGFQFEEYVKKVGYALVDLQQVSNLIHPQGPCTSNVNPQTED